MRVFGDAAGAPAVTLSGDRHAEYLLDASLVLPDVRAYVRSRRLDFADKTRTTLAASAGGFVAF